MDNTKEFTHLGLCAGYGGIELGLHRVIRNLRTVALCEIEAFACANLVAKMEAGLMDCAPIWTDLKTFPWAEFRDRVDILTSGYPCQPFSAAGKRAGTEDPRHLWPFIADGIRILRPKLCFFENVEGHISLGLREVIGELESIGYTAAWGIFSASEVGAPHQRKRVFILAYDQRQRIEKLGWQISTQPQLDSAGNDGCEGGRELAYAGRLEPQGWGGAADGQQSGAWRIPRGEPAPRHDQVWPSRPGEPQHAWEPPRVVGGKLGDSTHQRDFNQTQQDNTEAGVDFDRTGEGERVAHAGSLGRRGRSDGDEGGMCREIQTSGSCGGGAETGMAHAHGGRGEEPEHQQANLPTEPSGCNGEAMGNATSPRRSRPEDTGADRGDESQGTWREESERAGNLAYAQCELRPRRPERISRWIGQPSEAERDVAGSGSQGNGLRQTQPPLGRDADGPADWLDDAELYTTCDNRTDELRLLGNGVVPATAARAFLTLWEELFQQQPTN